MAFAGLKIGCCGFAGAQANYWKHFPVVEVQQTFYEPPQLATAMRWRAEAPAEAEFTLKAWQLITHEISSPTYRRLRVALDEASQKGVGSFKPTEVVWRAWQVTRDFARGLQAKVILFQCPASFKPTAQNQANLRRFFQAAQRDASLLGLEFQFAWEPRGDWRPPEIAALCAELNLVHAVDPFAGPPVTTLWCYFRLHGLTGFKHRYSDPELRQLAEWTRQFAAGYCLFNNAAMREDALRFGKLVAGASA